MVNLSSDRPCKGDNPEEEDLLGYYPFAETLADGIYESQPDDGLVIALYGPWGSGKSTLLNFVDHALIKKDPSFKIVRFNPWWFSGRENLTRDLIEQLVSAFSLTESISRNIKKLLHKYAEGIGNVADLSGITAGYGKVFGKVVSKITSPPSIQELKKDISKQLNEYGQKILVLVDDIDRLNPDEIHEIFTVIKALADFPNVIYLMAFDKKIVTSALKNKFNFSDGHDGELFLQKIVQVEFVMPQIERAKMSNMLIGHLQEIIEFSLYDEQQYQEYWNAVYSDMRFLFENPRDVNCFTNAISVTYPAVKGQVNPIDFIVIEAIRIFIPELYSTIKDFPEQFTKMEFINTWQHPMSEEQKKNFKQKWIDIIPEKIRENTIGLIKTIFPRLSVYTFNKEEIDQWANDLRICDQKILPIYFKFSLPDSLVSKSEVENLFTYPSDVISNYLLQYKNSNESKLVQVIEILSRSVNNINLENIPSFIEALFDIGDLLIPVSNSIWFFWDISDLAIKMIQRIGKTEYKEVLAKAISEGHSFTIPILAVSGLLIQSKKYERESINDIPQNVMDMLIKSIMKKMTDKIQAEPYWIPQCLPNVLAAWENIGGIKEAKEYCERQISSDDHILEFIRACQIRSLVSEGRKPNSTHIELKLPTQELARFIDFKPCIDKLKRIEEKKGLSEEDKKILEACENAVAVNKAVNK